MLVERRSGQSRLRETASEDQKFALVAGRFPIRDGGSVALSCGSGRSFGSAGQLHACEPLNGPPMAHMRAQVRPLAESGYIAGSAVDARRSWGFPEPHMGEQEPARPLRNAWRTAA